jgi:sirohydrochlorin cobaltochelatase
MTTGLILAGHGSHISPETAGIVWRQVDALRAMGVADEITAAFWKETPSYATVLNSLTARDITIVPLFTAQGYFTRTVIPAEMRLNDGLTTRGERQLRYARPLGEHPFVHQIVQQRVDDALQAMNMSPEKVGVALIGHGTKRNPQSRAATEAQVDALRRTKRVGAVTAVYLDDTPSIPEVYELLTTPVIIAVPNFLALGSHTTLDVPQALGLEPGQTTGEAQGHYVYYTDPIGVNDSLCQIIQELAVEVGARLHPARGGSDWDGFPAAGRDTLIEVVHQRGEARFGQLTLTPTEVRAGRNPVRTFDHVSALREHVRTVPIFRPLATSADLADGWRVTIDRPEKLHAVVETVYPGAVADWAADRHNHFTTLSLEAVVQRQTGMFRQLAAFTRTESLVKQVCGRCVRHPTWHDGLSPDELLPCREPCNYWMSQAL